MSNFFDELSRNLASGMPRGSVCDQVNGTCRCPEAQLCGEHCCNPGETCIRTAAGGATCCPTGRLCGSRTAPTCCPDGQKCINGTCCPGDRICGGGSDET